MNLVSTTYRLDDLGSEVPSRVEDSSVGGCTKLDSLAEDRSHSAKENKDDREQFHRPEKRQWKR